jgi:hypothetical protein
MMSRRWDATEVRRGLEASFMIRVLLACRFKPGAPQHYTNHGNESTKCMLFINQFFALFIASDETCCM